MKALNFFVISFLFVAAAALQAAAQSPISIVDHIQAGQVNSVTQSAAIGKLLAPPAVTVAPAEQTDAESEGEAATQASGSTVKMAGYRVRVFSDNNPRTAKNEARTKQRSIAARFPHYRTYVTFNSPYWRLNVGDFRTQQEAQAAADEIKQQFPAFSKEIRVVRDRINASN